MPTPAACILANKPYGTLYVGATIDLAHRMREHKSGFYPRSFSKKYATYKLVYYEPHEDAACAFQREYRLKGTNRARKIWLIRSRNPYWMDLSKGLE